MTQKKLIGFGAVVLICLLAFFAINDRDSTPKDVPTQIRTNSEIQVEPAETASVPLDSREIVEKQAVPNTPNEERPDEKVRVFGTVTLDSTSAPVADAEVVMMLGGNYGSYDVERTTTDDSGKFELEYRVNQFPMIYARKGSQLSYRNSGDLEFLEIQKDDTSIGPVHLKLYDASVLEVRVVSALSGKPLTGAKVRTLSNPQEDFEGNQQGLVKMVLSPEFWRLQVMAAGHEMIQANLDLSKPVEGVLEFALHPAGKITGKVVDLQGQAVGAAWVTYRGQRLTSMARTDDSGLFHLDHLPLNQTIYIHAFKQGLGRNSQSLELKEQVPMDLVLVLEPEATKEKPLDGYIEGVVVDENDQPLENATVAFQSYTSHNNPLEVSTNPDGFFSFVAPMEYADHCSLFVEKSGYAFQLVPLKFDQDRKANVKVILMPGHYLRGHVRDTSGEPIEGARLTASIPNYYRSQRSVVSETDREGYFELQNLPEKVILKIFAKGFTPLSNEKPTLDQDQAEFVLEGLGILRGNVVYKETGEPVKSYKIHFQKTKLHQRFGYSASDNLYPGGLLVNADDGAFEVKDLHVGSHYQISVDAGAYGIALEEPVPVLSPGKEVPLVLEVEPNENRYQGVVLNRDGRPISGVKLTLFSSARDISLFGWNGGLSADNLIGITFKIHQTSDQYGRFLFEHVPKAEFVNLIGEKEGFAPGFLGNIGDGTNDESEWLELRLMQSAKLTVSVAWEPYPENGFVTVYGENFRAKEWYLTDGVKEREFSDLRPGKYFVGLYSRVTKGRVATTLVQKEIDLQEGETVHVVLGEETYKIAGTAMIQGMPAAKRKIALKRISGLHGELAFSQDHPEVITDELGRFQFENLQPGEFKLMLFSRQRTWHQSFLSVSTVDSINAHSIALRDRDIEDVYEFHPGSIVRGSLASGSGISGVILSSHPSLANHGYQAVLQGDRRFEFLDIEPGTYSLHAMEGASGQVRLLLQNIVIPEDGSVVDLGEVDGELTGDLRLILDPSWIPEGLSQLQFTLFSLDDPLTSVNFETMARHAWNNIREPRLFEGLAEGNYRLVLIEVMGGYITDPKNPAFEIKAGETTDLIIRLKPITSMQGRLKLGKTINSGSMRHLESGQVVNFEYYPTAEIWPAVFLREFFAIFSENFFIAMGVAPGKWRLTMTYKDGTVAEKDVILTLGRLAMVAIDSH